MDDFWLALLFTAVFTMLIVWIFHFSISSGWKKYYICKHCDYRTEWYHKISDVCSKCGGKGYTTSIGRLRFFGGVELKNERHERSD